MDGVNTYNCQCPPEFTGKGCVWAAWLFAYVFLWPLLYSNVWPTLICGIVCKVTITVPQIHARYQGVILMCLISICDWTSNMLKHLKSSIVYFTNVLLGIFHMYYAKSSFNKVWLCLFKKKKTCVIYTLQNILSLSYFKNEIKSRLFALYPFVL